MTDDILTKDTAAQLLDCQPSTFEDMARSGKVPACKVGGSWVTTRSALAEWICAQAKANLQRSSKPAAPQATLKAVPESSRKGPPPLPSLA